MSNNKFEHFEEFLLSNKEAARKIKEIDLIHYLRFKDGLQKNK